MLQFLPNSRPWRTPYERNFSTIIRAAYISTNTEVISGQFLGWTQSSFGEMRIPFDMDRAAHEAALVLEGEYLGGGQIRVMRVFKGDPSVKKVQTATNPDTDLKGVRDPFPGQVNTKHMVAFLRRDESGYHIRLPDAEKKVSGTFVLFLGPSARGHGAFESQLFDFFR